MKKISLFAVALSAFTMSLASCSSDDEIEDESQIENTQDNNEGMYLSMSLKMASSASTRADAAEDVSYNEGSKNEFTINSAKLLIFEGKEGEDPNYSKYVTFYDLSTNELNVSTSDADNSISNSGKSVIALKNLKYVEGNQYYALVLVNKFDDNMPSEAQTFAAWNETAITAVSGVNTLENHLFDEANGGENFFMTNALLRQSTQTEATETTAATTTYSAQSLVNITNDLKHSRNEALNEETPVEILVERAVAKLSFSEGTKKYWSEGVTFASGSKYTGDIKFLGWYVDNIDKYTYPVHTLGYAQNGDTPAWGLDAFDCATNHAYSTTVTSSDIYNQILNTKADNAFVGADERIFWSYTPRTYGKDILGKYIYSTEYRTEFVNGDKFNNCVNGANGTTVNSNDANGVTSNTYCYIPENCQNYNHMTKGTNTRIILKAEFIPNVEGKTFNEGDDVFMVGDKPYTAQEIEDLLNAEFGVEDDFKVTDFDAEELNKEAQLGIGVIKSDCKSKYTQFSNYETKFKNVNTKLDVSDYTPLAYYQNGLCYYVAYLRHISDNNANWKTGDYTLDQLGRYGAVRNNWYDIQVDDVVRLGKPDVPDLPGPDDNDPKTDDEEYYIKVNVTILAWVKHSTSVSNLE